MAPLPANAVPALPRPVSRFHVGSARITPEPHASGDQPGPLAGLLLRGVNALDDSTWPLSLVGAAPARHHVCVATGWATQAMGDTPAWLPRNRPIFDAFAQHLARLAREADLIPTLIPFSQGVLSDSPSTLTFLRSSASHGWRFLLSPSDLWTDAIAQDGIDHLHRLLETIALHEACAGWIMPSGLGDNLAPAHASVTLPPNVLAAWHTLAHGPVITV